MGVDVPPNVVLRRHRKTPTPAVAAQTMTGAKWDRRIHRADDLVSRYPFCAEGLRYYTRVATFQKSLYLELQKALADSPKVSSDRPLRDELDLFLLLPKFPEFLSLIQQIAPAPFAQASGALAQKWAVA